MSWTNEDLVEVLAVSGESGLFARTDMAEGAVVGVFDGRADVFEVDGRGEVDWRGQDGGMSIHLKLAEGRLYAIMPAPGVPIRGIDFINHSCRPNCRLGPGGLVVETARPVRRGEQLTIDYRAMDLVSLGKPCWCEGVDERERCVI